MAEPTQVRKRKYRRIALWAVPVAIVGAFAVYYCQNNVSLMTDGRFARRLDEAIIEATEWVRAHQDEITANRNLALIMMLQDCHALQPEPLFNRVVERVLAELEIDDNWRSVLQPDRVVNLRRLNERIPLEPLDNRWMLYAIAPRLAELTDEDMTGLYDPERWTGRKLTHQLIALTKLQQGSAASQSTEALIDRLCVRLTGQLRWNVAVVDLYIQKVAFVLWAGHGEMVNRRWVERVINKQDSDGGWNDRWCRVLRSRRKPVFDFADPTSDEHATIQALWLLYQVKYRYPEQFSAGQS